MNRTAATTSWPSGFVTVIATRPFAWGGVTTTSFDELLTTMDVPAMSPKLTVKPLTNPVPTMVTFVPPFAWPCAGFTDLMVGAAATGDV